MVGCDSKSGSSGGQQPGPWTITASAGAGGTIAPAGAVTVANGASRTFTITPNASYVVASVTVDGVSVGAVTTHDFTNVTANHTIAATFTPTSTPTFTITASAGPGGTITPSGAVVVAQGSNQDFAIAANQGFVVSDVTVDGVSVGAVTTHTFTNVTAGHTVAATFIAAFTITASAGPGGTVAPSGAVTVLAGADQTFTLTPNQGFLVSNVTVDGASQGAVAEFTFTNVQADHAIAASFVAQPTSVVVRLVTQGTLPQGTLIGGIQATLTYATNKGLTISAGNVVKSGAGNTGASILVANANNAGQVIVVYADPNGIGAGEFATATFAVASPNVPVPSDFAIAPGFTVIDVQGAPIPGITVTIAPPDIV